MNELLSKGSQDIRFSVLKRGFHHAAGRPTMPPCFTFKEISKGISLTFLPDDPAGAKVANQIAKKIGLRGVFSWPGAMDIAPYTCARDSRVLVNLFNDQE